MTTYEVRQGTWTWCFTDTGDGAGLRAACDHIGTIAGLYPEARWGPVELFILQPVPAAEVAELARRAGDTPARAAA